MVLLTDGVAGSSDDEDEDDDNDDDDDDDDGDESVAFLERARSRCCGLKIMYKAQADSSIYVFLF
jgi:hypothetical protein